MKLLFHFKVVILLVIVNAQVKNWEYFEEENQVSLNRVYFLKQLFYSYLFIHKIV